MSAYIYDGLRTPFGRHAGALAPVRPDDLLSGVIRTLLTRGPFEPGAVEDVVIGCANQAGEDSRNVARHAALLAGLPLEVGGVTVNRLCGSGLAAVLDAARAVMTGQGELLVAGGVESMSRAPFAMGKAESPYSREAQVFDTTLGARFPNARLVARFGGDTMPETADNIARDLGIGRAATDRFALASQQKYATAQARGFFSGELVPVELPGRRGAVTTVSADEHPRADTTLDKLSTLKPLAPDGVVTAGNASGINDGAAALLIGSLNAGEDAGCKPLARIVSAAIAGVPPRTMGLGPVPAARKALERARLTLADVDVIEINEAFAVQVLGCLKLLELSEDDSRVNPNGGAIAVGHPLGASGARLALTAARQLQVSGGRYALVSMCIGVGQGIAAVLERV
ncbi:3-oxoadipyl-CoA thiolase [Myxococcus llanfairpwllgwyngyllgogerychwyrndrobwllllantysiliogogogochensis]|uniref:3-oxoadipyl-CoA thiolase n=1 Tax=Myxococcus llanfairpwllgwyngyllgogerychwyrndrobwllllantysiliogogogochensis TaxID=2590453 RepID=A0A540WW80_9BACT|nr:3-oxoadipyl-CoA thiolase [Myxococcus llanfairpwllgwyngyllgogerychwyrndrobwllllantysiliogogogochensis]TQF13190.1 3-oxoadipyl-CoA thiolase [Myxococcus llanfairpwllgwyngyllgogerychwyrndrobwllllantysiliogogogochensis]